MSSGGLSALLAQTLLSSVVVYPVMVVPLHDRGAALPKVPLHSPRQPHFTPPGHFTRADTASRSCTPPAAVPLSSTQSRYRVLFPPPCISGPVLSLSRLLALRRLTEEIFIFFLPFVQNLGEVTGRMSPPRGQSLKLHKQVA
ncbi:unnamed protein product [Boreogadus saida]